MEWFADCPAEQQLTADDGWYLLTVYSSPPPSGFLGDGQVIDVAMERVAKKPVLKWEGVPPLHQLEE